MCVHSFTEAFLLTINLEKLFCVIYLIFFVFCCDFLFILLVEMNMLTVNA